MDDQVTENPTAETNEEETGSRPDVSFRARRPDYLVRQYRRVAMDDGPKTRRESIGAGWDMNNGGINIRLNGVQIISQDVYLFPNEPLNE